MVTLNIPVLINGGSGKPESLMPRELYVDTDTGNLYYGSESKEVKPITIVDLSNLISSYLSDGTSTKTIAGVNISDLFISSLNNACIVDSADSLADKGPGVYFIKHKSDNET